ncbi:hypothetical protein SeGA_0454 [Salmonella enterica subsp. enterica serovar Gaminara str. A4-567]|nr:hypothetical protein SeGA_0454 [Salmonella enterica subsp. enterica serovar Gaminara str. A4-567]
MTTLMILNLKRFNVDDFEPEALATKPVKLPEKVRKVEAA